MSFKILVVTATLMEAEAVGRLPVMLSAQDSPLEINLLVTGVGSVPTAWSMQKWISGNYKPDLAINLGIAGSYREEIRIGDVVMPVTDCFADAGVEDGSTLLTLSEAGLAGANDFPFTGGIICADPFYTDLLSNFVKPSRAISVNTSTGSSATREKLVTKFNPDIETMEGATFFYICRQENIPYFALRGISNIVEIRNKDKWNIPVALKNVSEKLNELILTLK